MNGTDFLKSYQQPKRGLVLGGSINPDPYPSNANGLQIVGQPGASDFPYSGGDGLNYQTEQQAQTPISQYSGTNTGTRDITTGRSYGTGEGAQAAPAYDANELRALDQQKSLYERLLESAKGTLAAGLNSLADSYNLNLNRTNQDRSRALQNYSDQRNEVETSREKALNNVGDNSRTARNSLMRVLGMASGGGSAFDMADSAVAREATKNRSNVLDSYTSNVTNLGKAEEDAKTQFQRILEDLGTQKKSREGELRSGVLTQQQTIEAQLAQLAADRARLLGGDQFAAAEPYRQNYLNYQNQIDQIPGQFRTAVDYNPASLQQPTLKDYLVDRASIGGQAQGQQTQYSPYANFLRKQQDEQRLA